MTRALKVIAAAFIALALMGATTYLQASGVNTGDVQLADAGGSSNFQGAQISPGPNYQTLQLSPSDGTHPGVVVPGGVIPGNQTLDGGWLVIGNETVLGDAGFANNVSIAGSVIPPSGFSLSFYPSLPSGHGANPALDINNTATLGSSDYLLRLRNNGATGLIVDGAGDGTFGGNVTIPVGSNYGCSGTGICNVGAGPTAASSYSVQVMPGQAGNAVLGNSSAVSTAGTGGGAATVQSQPGAAGSGATAGGASGQVVIQTLAGGAGTASAAAGASGSLNIRTSAAGSNNGGGGANSGGITVTIGAPSGAGTYGALQLGGGSEEVLIGTSTSTNGMTAMLHTTSSQTPGSMSASACLDSSAITLASAAAGASCIVGTPAAGAGTGVSATCYVSSTGNVKIRWCNSSTGTPTATSGTYDIRVFNP